MPKNLIVEKDGQILRIHAKRPLRDAVIHINTVNNLTMIEQETAKFSGNKAVVNVSQLKLNSPYIVLVKLMQNDILKDEVVLNLGWKKF